MDSNDLLLELLRSVNDKIDHQLRKTDSQDERLGRIEVNIAEYRIHSEVQSKNIEQIQEDRKEDKKIIDQLVRARAESAFTLKNLFTAKNLTIILTILATITTAALAAFK
jgi:hypothetical protein